MPRERGALPPALNLEWVHGSSCTVRPSPARIRAEAQSYIDIVSRHYGQRPIVYVTPDLRRENLIWLLKGDQPWLRPVAPPLRDVYPGEDWIFWQYSGTGLVPGIEGEVDLNASSGSRWAWKSWLRRNTH